MAVRSRFDPKRDFVAARGFTFAGTEYGAGDKFDKAAATPGRLAMIYESRMISFAPDDAKPDDQITVTKVKAGYFDVGAPWLETPIRARGQVAADAAAAKLREEGPPLGWIDGGTHTTITGGDGGWYEVNAPWLDEPEKVQGREAAEARQRELHAEGEPAFHHGVTLTPKENGWWEVSANWDPGNVANVHGEEAARELATKWRAEGEPQDKVTITEGEFEDEWIITASWFAAGETILFEGSKEDADAKAEALRAEGPPKPE